MNRTVSQKIARIFEIAGYLWLAPSLISLFCALLVFLMAIFAFSLGGILISAIPFLLFRWGLFLLGRYHLHARDLLDEEKILPLWWGTLALNSLVLLPTIYSFSSTPALRCLYGCVQIKSVDIIVLLPVFWWMAAILLSGIAIFSEIRNQKYR